MGVDIAPDAIRLDDDVFEVWEENWTTVRAFLKLETQWNAVSTKAGVMWTGINYAAADVVLRRMGDPEGVFDDLQIMENAALDVLIKG